MFLLFSQSVFSLNPVVLIPGTMGSLLRATVTDRKTHWYCPKNLDNVDIWINEEYFIPPLVNCLGDWLTMEYDPVTKDAVNQPGVKMDIVDFGGVDGMAYLDDLFNSTHLLPYMHIYIKHLEKQGYTIGQNIFGAPFDWRRGLLLGKEHYNKMIKLCEEAYIKNDGQKVVLIGHSLGGYFIHYFLSNITTPEWRAKYIESAILVAPSFGGAGTIIEQLWNGKVSVLRSLGLSHDIMAKLASSVGALYVHLPNANAFGDTTVLIDENGNHYNADQAGEVLRANGKFRGTPEIYDLHKNFHYNPLKSLDVPTVLVYNDRAKTKVGWDASKKDFINGPGDNVVNDFGAKYFCNNWKSNKKLKCINLNSTSEWATHILMTMHGEYVDLVLKYATDQSWEH